MRAERCMELLGGYTRAPRWPWFHTLDDKVGLALRQHGLVLTTEGRLVPESEGLQGQTHKNFGDCGSLLICSAALCKEH